MSNIYDQHRAAFANVSAYVILKGGERVASVAFKFPRDGAGRLYCYLHVFGFPMVRAYAGGFGYDKQSAAMHAACRKLRAEHPEGRNMKICADVDAKCDATLRAITGAVTDSVYHWDTELERAGFKVLQAV